MEYSPYPRGSEWRKWDLHFHSPSSYDYKKKDLSNGEIIDNLAANGIELVAITDHHVIDVERIEDLQIHGREKGVTVLPGIEFLADSRGKDPVHFIGIFPEDESFDLEHTWNQIRERTALSKIRSENKEPNEVYCRLEETCDLIHQLGGIVSIHAGSKSNTIDNITHSLPHGVAQKTDIASHIDIFELGKTEDIDVYQNQVCKHLKREIPLVICSDNHDATNYEVKEFCWVKADPTFEGLRQVICEPFARVQIQAGFPDNKTGYRVIERVEISDTLGQLVQTIFFNSGLNSIIGGRSTGKSLLGATIALMHGEELINFPSSKIQFIKSVSDNFKVFWADGKEDYSRDIDYYPQSFVYELSRNDEELNNFFEEIIDQKGKRHLIEKYEASIEAAERAITDKITHYLRVRERLASEREKLKNQGARTGVESEIERIENALTKLPDLEITENDGEDYSAGTSSIARLEEENRMIEAELATLQALRAPCVSNPIEEATSTISDQLRDRITTYIQQLSNQINTEWSNLTSQFSNDSTAKIERNCKSISEIKQQPSFKKVAEAMASSAEFQELGNRRSIEKSKLERIHTIEKEVANLAQDLLELKKDILIHVRALNNLARDASEGLSIAIEEISLKGTPQLDSQLLVERILNVINKRSREASDALDTADKCQDTDSYMLLVETLFEALLEKKVTLKQGFDINSGLNHLLAKNYSNLKYVLRFDGDLFTEMSDGKRSFVILKLLLEHSDKDCPIILDQPEDDLDNRAISTDLVAYIRTKKQQRQIICISHNANVVVGSDTENIIVSNKDGKDSPNHSNYSFEYVQGGLEFTMRNPGVTPTLYKCGIREHVCDVLEGGKQAFLMRESKYHFDAS